MKVIISGGGTGGHIYPAIAIADALTQSKLATDILFVGARGQMEMQKVPEAGYPIIGLPISGLRRKQLLKNLPLPYYLVVSLWKSRKLLKDFRPHIVVGTGGYASAPLLYMAAQRHIATLIQEQNVVAGLANRILAHYVDRICVAYPNMATYFPLKKTVFTGNPTRLSLTQLGQKRSAACLYFGLSPHKKCLLVLGGSLGAQTINESILRTIAPLMQAGLQILWATGKYYFEQIKSKLSPQLQTHIKIYPFIQSIDLAYAVADIVLARAGALTIAELCVAQKPTIFVPSPNVVNDHQTKNVWPLVTAEAALMVQEQDVPQKLTKTILQLLQSPAQQNSLTRNMKAWAKPQATTTIVKEIVSLTKDYNPAHNTSQ